MGRTPIFLAAMTAGPFSTIKQRPDVVKMLLDRVADPNKADIDRGETPLHGAVWTRSMTVVRLLLKAGADPNKGDKDNVIPLHIAITTTTQATACYFLIKLLLDEGSDPNTMDKHGNTPLSRAMLLNPVRHDMVKLLLESGANPSEKEKEELRGWSF